MSGAALKALSAAAEPESPCRPRPASPLSRRPASAGVRVGGRCTASAALAAILHLALLGAAGGGDRRRAARAGRGAGDGCGRSRPTMPTARPATPAIAQPLSRRSSRPRRAVPEPRVRSFQGRHGATEKASARSQATAPAAVDPAATPPEALPASETAAVAGAETDAAEVDPEAGMMKVALAEPRAAMPELPRRRRDGAADLPDACCPGRRPCATSCAAASSAAPARSAGGRPAAATRSQFERRLAGLSLLSQSSQGEARRQRPGSCSLRRSTCAQIGASRQLQPRYRHASASPARPPDGRSWRAARTG